MLLRIRTVVAKVRQNRVLSLMVGVTLATASLPISAEAAEAAVVAENFQVEMDDGVKLAALVLRPDDGERHPVVISFTPYGVARDPSPLENTRAYYAKHYRWIRIIVDVRGTGGSEGTFCLWCAREQRDYHDMVEWSAGLRGDLETTGPAVLREWSDGTTGSSHPSKWSDGKVASMGQSYAGIAALLAAATNPRGLEAIAPASALSDPYRDGAWHNGMLSQNLLAQWVAYQNVVSAKGATGSTDEERRAAGSRVVQRAGNEKIIDTVLTNPYYSRTDTEPSVYTERGIYEKRHLIKVPVLLIDGWFDGFSMGAIRNLQGISNARLLMGPYGHHHGGGINEPQSDPSYPLPDKDIPDANYEAVRLNIQDAWLEEHLTGSRSFSLGWNMGSCPISDDWKICYFDRGAKRWQQASSWPVVGSGVHELFLAAPTDPASTEGSLDAAPAIGRAANSASYAYDPTIGVTDTFSKWGEVAISPQIALDQGPDEKRSLTYTTPPLDEPLQLAGPMELRFFASTTAPDTDFVVKVARVAEDGSSRLITSGYLKASQRKWDDDRSKPGSPWITNLEEDATPPGSGINEYRIDIWDIAWTIEPGERLRIALSSSDSPSHTPSPFAAINTIFHDEKHPSRLIITTMPYGVPEVALEVTPDEITGNGPVVISASTSDVEGVSDVSSIDLSLGDAQGRILDSWTLADFVAEDATTLRLSAAEVQLSGPSPWSVALTATDTDGASATETVTIVRIEDDYEDDGDDEDEADASEETSTAPTMTGGRGSLVRTPI